MSAGATPDRVCRSGGGGGGTDPAHTAMEGERTSRCAGDRALELADRAMEADDDRAAAAAYLTAAGHYRRAAELAAAAQDEGARRADEAAAVDALYAALPLTSPTRLVDLPDEQ